MILSSTLPPWGLLDQDYLDKINARPIPEDWHLKPARKPALREWERWRNSLVRELSSVLWPVYEPGGTDWSSQHVGKLIESDFELLKVLRPHLDRPITGRYRTTITHSMFFSEEDDSTVGFGSHYERYDPQVPADFLNRFQERLRTGFHGKVGTLALQLKQRFQRPRAYQVALIQERQGFTHRPAQTADTPSMVSGHCLQGALAGCHVFAEEGSRMSKSSLEILQQFTVDIGDRRVFAGVHYPSDNLGSWLAALTLIPRVFPAKRGAAVQKFLGAAITEKSAVFDAVDSYENGRKTSPYAKAIARIRRLI